MDRILCIFLFLPCRWLLEAPWHRTIDKGSDFDSVVRLAHAAWMGKMGFQVELESERDKDWGFSAVLVRLSPVFSLRHPLLL